MNSPTGRIQETPMTAPIRVLFLCTGNSARSQMAESLLRNLGGERYEVHSAGTEPRPLHPLAVQVMGEAGVDIAGRQSKSLARYLGQCFDYIITVCDRARDNCPTFPGDSERIHWGFEDPAEAGGSEEEQLKVFRRVRNEISERIRLFTALHHNR
jgi:arsenate reductase